MCQNRKILNSSGFVLIQAIVINTEDLHSFYKDDLLGNVTRALYGIRIVNCFNYKFKVGSLKLLK